MARASKVNSDFRGKLREEVERLYPEIVKALEVAMAADVTKWGDCPRCKKRVPVTFPDLPGRMKAIQFLAEAAHGRPPETVEITVGPEADLGRWMGYLSRMTEKERVVMRDFLRREVGLEELAEPGELLPALPAREDVIEQERGEGLSANGAGRAA